MNDIGGNLNRMYSNESTQLPLSGQITGKTVWYQRDIVYKLKPVKQVTSL